MCAFLFFNGTAVIGKAPRQTGEREKEGGRFGLIGGWLGGNYQRTDAEDRALSL